MFKYERLRIIENLLHENGSVSTSELSDLLHVTEETVRNDLAELQDADKIKRVRGGAYLIETVDNEVPMPIRDKMMLEEKERITEICLAYIESGDTIALDSSTTAICLARAIKKRNLSITVITNSIVNASLLMDAKDVNLIVLGGTCRKKSSSLVGNVTAQAVKNYVIDKAFVSCSGIAIPSGPSDTNEQEAKIRENIICSSAKTFLIADHTKFDFRTVYLISDFNAINYIVTDQDVAQDWKDFLREKDIQLLY